MEQNHDKASTPETAELITPVQPEDTIAVDALAAVPRPSPATIPHTRLQSIAEHTPTPHRIPHTEQKRAYLERQHHEGYPDVSALPNPELPEDLTAALLEVIGEKHLRTDEIILALFGVSTIHPAKFTPIHSELKKLCGTGVLIKDDRNNYQRREAPVDEEEAAAAALEERLKSAGIYPTEMRRASSVNHHTARTGVRRRK